jgi:DNA mismatch repair protein MutH
MGLLGSAYHSLDFSGNDYILDKHIIGLDLEKMLGASFTGYNSKSGDLLTVKLKDTGMNSTGDMVYTTLHYDALLEINDAGCTLME